MLNGQLKAAYNIQIAVENYFIVQAYVSNDRTDYNTLIPVLEKHKNAFGEILEEVTADSGSQVRLFSFPDFQQKRTAELNYFLHLPYRTKHSNTRQL